MRSGLILVLMFACAAQAQQSNEKQGTNHETAEDKARTVPGGASIGVKSCHKDIELFCKDIKPGGGRLGKCLKADAKKLSKSCKRWLEHGGQSHIDAAFQEIDRPAPIKP